MPASVLSPTPLDHYDWSRIYQDLDAEGWALLPGLFPPALARQLALPESLPRVITMMDALKPALYSRLLPLARAWTAAMQQPSPPYPDTYADWLLHLHAAGQTRTLSAVHRLGADGYQPLTHHADGEVFPLQLVALLSAPDQDYTGGEFVMTEQRPRMQSRPMVLPLQQGDAAVIAVSHRPVQGAHDVYRVTARQAVSRVRSGERVGLEVLLHDGR